METIINEILKKRVKFLEENNKCPQNIHLSIYDMKRLSNYFKHHIILQRAKDLKERLMLNLLLTIKEIPLIKKGNLFFGMCIEEEYFGETYLS